MDKTKYELTFLGMRKPPSSMSPSVRTRALAGITGYSLKKHKYHGYP
jgi:hypothetical protein